MSVEKRLILIHTDKGGTGKSTVARGLLEWYQHQEQRLDVIDSDKRNTQLYRYYHAIVPVQRLDVTISQGIWTPCSINWRIPPRGSWLIRPLNSGMPWNAANRSGR